MWPSKKYDFFEALLPYLKQSSLIAKHASESLRTPSVLDDFYFHDKKHHAKPPRSIHLKLLPLVNIEALKTQTLNKNQINLLLQFILWMAFIFFSREEESSFTAISLLLLIGPLHLLWSFFSSSSNQKISLKIILPCAFALHLLFIFSQALYEDDYYRYIWDGMVTSNFDNALIVSPREVMDASSHSITPSLHRDQLIEKRQSYLPDEPRHELLSKINYPESPSIYGPLAQVFLGAVFFIAEKIPDVDMQKRVQFLRLILIGLVFLCVAIIWALCKKLTISGQWACAIFVLHPIVLKEVSNSLHIDILSLLLVLLSLYFALQKKSIWSVFFLALAVLVKPYSLFLLPFILVHTGKYLRGSLVFFITLALAYLPFLLSGGLEIFAGFRYYSLTWSMNDVPTAFFREILAHAFDLGSDQKFIDPIGEVDISQVQVISRGIGLSIFILCTICLWLKRRAKLKDPEVLILSLSDILMLLYIFSPVQDPWYLLWGLPFHIMTKRWPYLVFIAFSEFYLFNFTHTSTTHILHPFQWWAFVPYLAMGASWVLLKSKVPPTEVLAK